VVEVFPVAIGYYSSPDLEDLDVETQVGRLVDLLAPFGGVHRAWAHPPRDRGADAVQKRLNSWASLPTDVGSDALVDRAAAESPDGAPESSVLYWVGHGWSDGHRSALAHAHSPAAVGAAGVAPQQLAYALRSRRALLDAVLEGGDEDGWAMVVVDACRSTQVMDAITEVLVHEGAPRHVLLLAVTAEGATPLGRFTDALQNLLLDTFRAEQRIPLRNLAAQLERVLGEANVYERGLGNAALTRIYPPVAAWMSAPMDTIRHLEDVLNDLSPDERWHFLVKARGAEHGEVSWFFEGRHEETAEITAWLRATDSGMFIVSGRAGSGKSALLGNLLVHSLPDLREALARRGLITLPAPSELPPAGVFDVVIHLSGLNLKQATSRIAVGAGLGNLPSQTNPSIGVATDIDWLVESLSARLGRERPLTILVDALDEAVDPLGVAGSLLARIAALPGVRVLVGTRASTNETPDAPADDQNLLDALSAGRSGTG
jgi:hypothetical protein